MTAIATAAAFDGVNPFEFRAGLKRKMFHVEAFRFGLNPFEFRAGLKRGETARRAAGRVLIPLNSGLA